MSGGGFSTSVSAKMTKAAPGGLARPKGHPAGLYVLFLTEMWERFSYYGMRALLVLFLVSSTSKGGLGWDQTAASQLYGWYTGLVYLTPLIGGLLADRFLGTHRSLLIGGSIIALGHFSLALETSVSFYAGLLLIILGTGFFKPCVSTMVGSLYPQGDTRRDAGFTIFYMGINLGALLGTLACGYLGESPDWGWRYGFGAAGVGMVAGLLVYAGLKPRFLSGVGAPPATPVLSGSAAQAPRNREPVTLAERRAVLSILLVAAFVVFFWMAYEQAGSSMNLFAMRQTRRTFLGFDFPASWFQAINPAAILLLSPIFAWGWGRLGQRGLEPSTTAKMGVGMLLLGGGFLFMVGASLEAQQAGAASPGWLIATYLLHTTGELCLSPVGLAFVSKTAPPRFGSLLMGAWFLANFLANLLAGYLAGAQAAFERGLVLTVFGGPADFYLLFVISSATAGVLLLLLTPALRRLTEPQA